MTIPSPSRVSFPPLLLLLLPLALLVLAGPLQAEEDPGLKPEVGHLLPAPATPPETLRVVSFNVHYASDVPRLAESIRANANLRHADVFLLQEIESHQSEGASRTRKLAQALKLNYVYAPARRTEDGGTHGLAILSRFPLSNVKVLPLKQFDLGFHTRRRIALAVTLDVAGRPLRLYNLHLDTRLNAKDRIEQLHPVVEAARRSPVAEVIIGGDFNTNPFRWLFHVFPLFGSHQAKALDEFMKENGFATPLANSGSTTNRRLLKMRVDSLYTRGLSVTASAVERSIEISDHFPLWMDIVWASGPAEEQ